ncbi:MAG TPA: AMP-binding protein [Terriglobales bacterium]|nr:AMP-binding protein [Terriglobales bacterium]
MLAAAVPRAHLSANIACLEIENLERYGVYPRLHFAGRNYTNAEELQYAGRLARVLQKRGVIPGERVAVILPNTPDLTASYQAIWTVGAVVVPVIPMWTAAEITHVLRHSGATGVLTMPRLAPVVQEAGQGVENLKYKLVVGEGDVAGMENVTSELANASSLDTPAARSHEDLAMLLYTSGTTARPKGVMITHANIAAALESATCLNPDLPRRPMLHALPLTHVFGLLMMKLANAWGLRSVLLGQFDPLKVFQLIEAHRIGYLPAVPTMLVYLLHHPERGKFDLSSLYRMTIGGAALPEKLRLDCQEVFAGRIEQGYGLSESVAVGTEYDDHEMYRPGSAGRPEPGVELRIVDEQNHSLPAGQAGEICLRGANICAGYWQDREATRQAFQEGWFHTGDVGHLDADGYLYITDRKKDLIIKGGENISSREIEETLYLHPAVAEAAVVGMPDAVFGEDICAVVQLKPGTEASDEDIRRHVGQHLARFKVPRRVVFQAALPKNWTGKIQKRALREHLASRTAA